MQVRRLDDPDGGPPLFRIVGPAGRRHPRPAPSRRPSGTQPRRARGRARQPRGAGQPGVRGAGRDLRAPTSLAPGASRIVDEVAHAYVELAPPFLDEALAELAGPARHGGGAAAVPVPGRARQERPAHRPGPRAGGLPRRPLRRRARAGRAHRCCSTCCTSGRRRPSAGDRRSTTGRCRAARGRPGRRRWSWSAAGRAIPTPTASSASWCGCSARGAASQAVLPAFAGITTPRLAEALELAARGAARSRILVVPYLLFAGRLVDRLRERGGRASARATPGSAPPSPRTWAPTRACAPSSTQRLDEALGRRRRPCPATPASTGRRWRAWPTASAGCGPCCGACATASPTARRRPTCHAHRPLAKHVLVCGNVDCAAAGSLALIERLRRLVKQRRPAAGHPRDPHLVHGPLRRRAHRRRLPRRRLVPRPCARPTPRTWCASTCWATAWSPGWSTTSCSEGGERPWPVTKSPRLRLGLMRVLGRKDEAERQHEMAELGNGAEAPGPIRSLCEAARPGEPAALLRQRAGRPERQGRRHAAPTTRSCPTTARWWC